MIANGSMLGQDVFSIFGRRPSARHIPRDEPPSEPSLPFSTQPFIPPTTPRSAAPPAMPRPPPPKAASMPSPPRAPFVAYGPPASAAAKPPPFVEYGPPISAMNQPQAFGWLALGLAILALLLGSRR